MVPTYGDHIGTLALGRFEVSQDQPELVLAVDNALN
jgi:hypothetical protein